MPTRFRVAYKNYVLGLIGVALLVAFVLFCVTAVNVFWPKKSADVSNAITALQDAIKNANDAHPCFVLLSAEVLRASRSILA